MIHLVRSTATLRRALTCGALATVSAVALAQTAPEAPQSSAGNLDIPANLQIFGKLDPNVRKPTAIVNDTVITGTDVDQRIGLLALANKTTLAQIPPDQLNALKLQVLRQLIDETLEIQEAKTAEITITASEMNQSIAGIAQRFGYSRDQLRTELRKAGSSEASLRRQIEAELAWQRYLRKRIEPLVNVGDEEVKGIISRLEQAKGTQEFNLREIYLSATDADQQQVFAKAREIIAEIQKGQQPFDYFARNFSEASTRAVGGDLGWVRASTLPGPLAEAAQQMQTGQVVGPIATPGGFSILYLVDKRQLGAADPRDARLSLKQLTVRFPAGTTEQQAQGRATEFAKTVQTIQGCGTVEKVAKTIGAEVVDNDTVRVRDLPPQLQDIILKLQVGQSTPPFGSPQEGVRALVLCGRDDPKAGDLPRADQIQGQLEQQRVNLRAQSKLRDLRRDAVIEYR